MFVFIASLIFLMFCPAITGQESKNDFPPVFPIPQQTEYMDEYFGLNENTVVLLPVDASDEDISLSQFLVSELAERHDLVLETRKVPDIAGMRNFILMGSVANPLIREYADEHNIPVSATDPGPEGYFLQVTGEGAAVMGSNDQGAFYGLQSLRQLINRQNAARIQYATIKDWPHMPFRGIHMYIPGPDNIVFFKRFVRDFLAYFKYNRIIMEVNAVMRFDRHPEVNAGWVELHKDMVYTRRISPRGPKDENQDSVHDNAGDGKVLSKKQVADVVNYARQFNIEVIPEIPSLTHCYYLLTRHRELAEIEEAEWPDTYCPLEPGSYELYFDIVNEYIEVIRPEIISIGHDEWRMPVDVCEKCKGKDYTELFIQDVRKLHDYLSSKNIRTAMWGDHFVKSHRGQKLRSRSVQETGHTYQIPGALTPEQVKEHIPKDILILNWSWNYKHNEDNVKHFHDWGFEQVLGNFWPHGEGYEHIEQRSWEYRSQLKGVLGAEVSPWRTFNETLYGTRIYRMTGSANHLWSSHYPDAEGYNRLIQNMMPEIRRFLKGEKPPSMENNPVQPLDISASFNTRKTDKPHDMDFELLQQENVITETAAFELADPAGKFGNFCATLVQNASNSGAEATRSKNIKVDMDASSLIFLHTCASRANHDDLLGWYRIIYEDGFEILVPVAYGVHIREWNLWKSDLQRNNLCYESDIVNCSGSRESDMNFFTYEWRNPRFGIKIKEVRLEGSSYRNQSAKLSRVRDGELIADNAIALIALSCVTKRSDDSSRAEAWDRE